MPGRREDRNAFPFLLPRAPSLFSRAQNHISLPFGTPVTQARLSLKQWKKNGMFVLVTLRFLSNLPITLIASLLYFFHVSVVCFNLWLKLSIQDNVLLNSMYKSCLLFVLHVLTTKIELIMPVRSLNIDLSNLFIYLFAYFPVRVRLWMKTYWVPRVSFLRK